jgi:hypothetical protein
MPQTGILNNPGATLNVYVAKVYNQAGQLTETFHFTRQYTRVEIEAEAVKLYKALHTDPKDGPSSVDIAEHEVLSKDPVEKSSNHGQFVQEIHMAVAVWRQAVIRRFGHDNGAWWSIFNGKTSEAQNDLIEQSRYIP